jgi:D-serine deaminase-like pyridoxal phosphate-dependent protein
MFSFCFMMYSTVKRERAEQILGELAELSLMLARDLAVQARAAEDTEEKVALTAAFQKMARTTRLTLALDAKLDRDAARDAAAAARAAEEAAVDAAAEAAHRHLTDPSPEETQKRRVKGVLNRLLWNESEGDQEEYEVLVEDLDARLYEAEDAPGFADMPIEVLAQKLAADMRLSGELVVTTAERIVPANTPTPPLADTG